MAKLTLHVPSDLVSAAKREAAARRVSVSKLVSDFFCSLAASRTGSEPEIDRLGPRTRRLAGCIPATATATATATDADVEDYVNYLERKHS